MTSNSNQIKSKYSTLDHLSLIVGFESIEATGFIISGLATLTDSAQLAL